MATGSIKPEKTSDRYFELVKAHPLRPIHSERDLKRAIEVLDALTGRKRNKDEEDYLVVLSDLIERYETDAIPEPAMSDALMLEAMLEARNLTQAQVARETGIAESTISSVLKGTRKLTREQVGKLSVYFGVQPSRFVFEA